jgi:hypothetical protein
MSSPDAEGYRITRVRGSRCDSSGNAPRDDVAWGECLSYRILAGLRREGARRDGGQGDGEESNSEGHGHLGPERARAGTPRTNPSAPVTGAKSTVLISDRARSPLAAAHDGAQPVAASRKRLRRRASGCARGVAVADLSTRAPRGKAPRAGYGSGGDAAGTGQPPPVTSSCSEFPSIAAAAQRLRSTTSGLVPEHHPSGT